MISKYVHFKSRKATCIERTGLRREIKRDLYEAAIVFGADVSAHDRRRRRSHVCAAESGRGAVARRHFRIGGPDPTQPNRFQRGDLGGSQEFAALFLRSDAARLPAGIFVVDSIALA